jgi:hypothetical protein
MPERAGVNARTGIAAYSLKPYPLLHCSSFKKGGAMPWYNGDYPPSYKNQPKKIRDKATEIANKVLETTGNEGEAIATGLKQARLHFKKEKEGKS